VDYFPSPVDLPEIGYFQIKPCNCSGCGKPMEHFDAGCSDCAKKEDW
jgi:predicted amidophosphoribosyltransferase